MWGKGFRRRPGGIERTIERTMNDHVNLHAHVPDVLFWVYLEYQGPRVHDDHLATWQGSTHEREFLEPIA